MRYAPPIIATSVVASIAVFACSESDSPTKPTMVLAPGDPAAVTFPCIGVPAGMQADWPQERVFLESQGWWGEEAPNGTIPELGNAEHIHIGMCFPLQKTVSDTVELQVRVWGHNLVPGSVVTISNLHDPGGGSIPSINWNHTIQQGEINWTDTRRVKVNTDGIQDGMRELRNLTKVVKPGTGGDPGPELHVSSGWCWDIENDGGQDVASGICEDTPRTTMGRGWYDCFEYKIAEADGFGSATAPYPYQGVGPDTSLKIYVGLRDGGGDNATLTSWGAYLNPDFHNGDDGEWDTGGAGARNGLLTIPANQTTPGTVERLTLVSHARSTNLLQGECNSSSETSGISPQTGEVSGVIVFPIKVKTN